MPAVRYPLNRQESPAETRRREIATVGSAVGRVVGAALHWGEPSAQQKEQYETKGPLGLGGYKKKKGYRYPAVAPSYARYLSARTRGPGRH